MEEAVVFQFVGFTRPLNGRVWFSCKILVFVVWHMQNSVNGGGT